MQTQTEEGIFYRVASALDRIPDITAREKTLAFMRRIKDAAGKNLTLERVGEIAREMSYDDIFELFNSSEEERIMADTEGMKNTADCIVKTFLEAKPLGRKRARL